MEQTMIKTENLSKRFGSFALQDIHFELPAGYICGLIGENGVGKTTLLNILAGLYEYDGTISIQEKEYRTNQMELQQDIGFVFHEEWFDEAVHCLQTVAYDRRTFLLSVTESPM